MLFTMTEALQILTAGAVGCFWPWEEGLPAIDSAEPERGYLRISERGVEIETLVEQMTDTGDFEQPERLPLLSLTPAGATLVSQITSAWSSERGGGYRTSSRHYRARSAVGGINLSSLRSAEPRELHAQFHGLSRFVGFSAAKEDRRTDPDGLLKVWEVRLEVSEADERVQLDSGRELVVGSHWDVGGTAEQRTMSASTSIGCASAVPVPMSALLDPLLRVQDLLNLAFQAFVPASTGTAWVDCSSGGHGGHFNTPWFWNQSLMSVPIGAQERSEPWLLFDLATIGGAAALGRWIALANTHPRALQTVVRPYRFGFSSPSMQLLDAAAGIETWVKSWRPEKWANGKLYAQQLARRVGDAFTDFVGDPDAWGHALFNEYNALKHDPEHVVDERGTADLAESARLLLGAALLDHIAGSSEPSIAIFGGGRLWQLGDRLRAG